MKIAASEAELKREIRAAQAAGKSIGFVPTMGALHRGHGALLEAARAENDFVVLSVYVNPTQFGPNEDFAKYPRAFAADCQLAEAAGADLVFHPTNEVIYPPGYSTFIEVAGVSEPLCGRFRPGHFRGVATVVHRLFQLVEPTRAYFGKKDIQQCLVLKRMTADLGLGLELRLCETIREGDGLALSSRNQYLSAAEREKAPLLYKALQEVAFAFAGGERDVAKLESIGRARIETSGDFRLQYLEVLGYPELNRTENAAAESVCAVAAYLGSTRLIDNILLR